MDDNVIPDVIVYANQDANHALEKYANVRVMRTLQLSFT